MVKLLVEQKFGGEGDYQKVFIWDADQELRFYYYSGDPEVLSPVECADPKSCPVVSFADSACVPQEEQCGKVVHPPVKFWMGGSVQDDICNEVLQQGETKVYTVKSQMCANVERRRLMTVRSMKMIENNCDDLADRWLGALIFDNRKVSQCLCQDHDDCANGQICETEVGRCVAIVYPVVPREAEKEPDPYTGICFSRYDQSLTPCKTTADCAASGKGVCNTWWKNISAVSASRTRARSRIVPTPARLSSRRAGSV